MRRGDAVLADAAAQGWAGIGEHFFGGAGEERHVCSAVADVGKALLSEPVMKDGKLLVSGEVCCAIAAENAMEDGEVLSYAFGETDIGAGGEVEIATASVFLLQELKELAVVGQVGDVELNVRGNEGLEGGFAAQQSTG